MAQIRLEATLQKRDRDLTETDDILTEDKLDTLWEWFCMASQDSSKFQPQLIFAKLVNGVRKPYRDNLPFPAHDCGLFTPSTSVYAPSEYTMNAEVQYEPDHSEGKAVIESITTKLAIAEDALQRKQAIIENLESSLQMKETVIKHLETSLETKRATLNQLEECIKRMDEEHREYNERVQGEKMQLELELEDKDLKHQKYTEKIDTETKELETRLKEMDQEHREYKQQAEGEKSRLETSLKERNQELRKYQWTMIEKTRLASDLQTLRSEHEKCRPIQVILRAGCGSHFIGVTGGEAQLVCNDSEAQTFTLWKHPNGMTSFQIIGTSIKYLSADASDVPIGEKTSGGSVKLSESCGSKEKFWLHDSDYGARFKHIECVDYPGRFLSACGNGYDLLIFGAKVADCGSLELIAK
ncbi:hypothetical protein BDZ91DRAFT_749903 [Kalaharituber pfeilii]|nr:hypothetical protein BDZ91DRAFT_749903 [Kalaharituber pfeilii]